MLFVLLAVQTVYTVFQKHTHHTYIHIHKHTHTTTTTQTHTTNTQTHTQTFCRLFEWTTPFWKILCFEKFVMHVHSVTENNHTIQNPEYSNSFTICIIQNQFQIQGLELDYTLVCWDADFRRAKTRWEAYNISGTKWQKQSKKEEQEYRENSYRVLLTRARKGMVIYIPNGDASQIDETRNPLFYDGIFEFLVTCGCVVIN